MSTKKRLLFLALGTFGLFSLLIMQYFKIQILESEKWSRVASAQHEYLVTMPAKRGTFFAHSSLKGGHLTQEQPLVIDVTKFHLYLDPLALPPSKRTLIAETIGELLHKPVDPILEACLKKSRSRRVALWLDQGEKERILQWWLPFARKQKIARNALYFVTDYQRSYPFGSLFGQGLHTIREYKEEKNQEAIPTGGLEAVFNPLLKGKVGKRKLLRSPLNALEGDTILERPEDGADIYLTINHALQAIAEEELEKGVKVSSAKGGWAVMMHPRTGEILALAQYPFFDPAHYRLFFNDPEKMECAKVKALNDAFEPGSIMKPITVAICLKANEELAKRGEPPLFNPEEAIDTTRAIFPGRASKPLVDVIRTKRLNLLMALQKSSNVYMAEIIDRLINRMGNDWYRSQLVSLFGFGKKTGIELPGETAGLVPTPGKLHPNGALEWSLPTPYSLAMGHNILATALQMLRAYSVFASGGILVEPTLIRKVVKKGAQGEPIVLMDHTQEARLASFPRVLSSEVVKKVCAGMKFTTKEGGTAKLADIPGYTEAGKTGTAEKIVNGVYSKKNHISSFIGFAPADLENGGSAELLLIVSIDDPEKKRLEDGGKNQMAGRCAAPVFREIARRSLEYLGVAPDDPHGYPSGDPRASKERADWGNEVAKLKVLFEQWNQ